MNAKAPPQEIDTMQSRVVVMEKAIAIYVFSAISKN